MQQIVDEVTKEYPNSEIEIWIYNLSTGVFTVYYPMTSYHGALHIPSYTVLVRKPEVIRMYFGALQENGDPLPFSQILSKYYEGSLTALLATMLWGGTEERDSEIVEDMGMQYRSFRVDFLEEKPDNSRAADNVVAQYISPALQEAGIQP